MQEMRYNTDYEILTPNGFQEFSGVMKSIKQTLIVNLERSILKCTLDHKVRHRTMNWVEAASLKPKDSINTKFGVQRVVSVELLGETEVYDAVNVDGGHIYYSNDVESHNCLYLDEFAFLHPNMAMEFFESVYPTVSSGKETKILISSTPKGLNHFWRMFEDAENGRSEFVAMKIAWNEVPGRDEEFKRKTIATIGELSWEQEYAVSFQGSANTLISGAALKGMTPEVPLNEVDGLTIWNRPVRSDHHAGEDGVYVMSVDCSEGVGADYTVANVIDVSSYPFRTVARFRSNTTSPLHLPDILVPIAKLYNDAFMIFEINSAGKQVADLIRFDYEYENLLLTSTNERKRQQLMFGSGSEMVPGVRMTKSVKKLGCSHLKHLIENQKLIIRDAEAIFEFSNFIRKGDTFQAEEGYHDDIVMSYVVFAWLIDQDYFKEITNTNVRKMMFSKMAERFDEDLPKFFSPQYSHEQSGPIIMDGAVWS